MKYLFILLSIFILYLIFDIICPSNIEYFSNDDNNNEIEDENNDIEDNDDDIEEEDNEDETDNKEDDNEITNEDEIEDNNEDEIEDNNKEDNKDIYYSKELHNLLSKEEIKTVLIDGDLNVKGKTKLKNINSKELKTKNINVNGDINMKTLNGNKIVIGGKYVLYNNKDAFVIGRLDEKTKKIAPALYLNPGSKEGMWIVENYSDDKVWYYWFNSGKSGHAGRGTDSNSLDGILTNVNHRPFKAIDKLK